MGAEPEPDLSAELSPSERYAAAKRRALDAQTQLHRFRSQYGFLFDDFQTRACQALESGHSVLVAAPTGAGKTVVGEFAVWLALQRGTKCFYTTPIKALSNQKFTELVARHGPDRVGLLTGDNAINGEADVVVMTTEVLRNMLYTGSLSLARLSYVVMDEVHYLADRSRGAVWEEVLIHLPGRVSVVSLSATVSNAEEFGDWLSTVRGDTAVVVEERRPVPLYQHVMAGPRMYDLFVDDQASRVNPELSSVARQEARRSDDRRPRRGRGGRPQRPRSRLTPMRVEVIERLRREHLLPAITFIFSRAGCDAAVEQCLAGGLRLTEPEEREAIRAAAQQPVLAHPARRSGGPGLLRLAGRPGAGGRGAPRRAAAGVQGDCRAAVPAGTDQGGLRDRDAGPGHQHAGPVGGAGEAHEMERRAAHGPQPGGVHAADRARRPSRASTWRGMRSSCGTPIWSRPRSRGWRPPAPTRCARASGPATTWR